MQELSVEQEFSALKSAFEMVKKVRIEGPEQGALLAQLSDAIAIVINSINLKKQNSVKKESTPNSKSPAQLSLIPGENASQVENGQIA